MKTLTQIADTERQSRSQNIYWLLEIDWSDMTRYYSTRRLSIEGREYKPLLLEIGKYALGCNGAIGNMTPLIVEMVNRPEDTERIESRFAVEPPEGLECCLGVFFRDGASQAGLSDIVYLDSFIVKEVKTSTARVWLYLEGMNSLLPQREMGRIISTEWGEGITGKSLGRMAPIVFGHVKECPLLPFRMGMETRLSIALQLEDTIAYVDSVEGIPSSGAVQIEDEVIVYSEIDPVEKTVGTASSPLVRNEVCYHSAHSRVLAIPEDGFTFLVADHSCKEVSAVEADGKHVDESEYEVKIALLNGEEVQEVVFPRMPVRTDYTRTLSSLSMDGRTFEGAFSVGEGATALDPEKAYDSDRENTFSVLKEGAGVLDVVVSGDLTEGERLYGKIEKVNGLVRLFASKRWATTSTLSLRVEKGAQYEETAVPRDSEEATKGFAASHGHVDDISFVAPSMPLLVKGTPMIATVPFENVESDANENEEEVWVSKEYVKDNDFTTASRNCATIEEEGRRGSLRLRLERTPLSDTTTELRSVTFKVKMRSLESGNATARLSAMIGTKYSEEEDFVIDGVERIYGISIGGENISNVDLITQETCFTIEAPLGEKVEVFESWLSLDYTLLIPGATQSTSLTRMGGVKESVVVPVALPTPVRDIRMDVTNLVMGNGEWDFFSSGGGYPAIKVTFTPDNDDTEIYVCDVAFEIEYKARTGATIAECITADVMGYERDGLLLENPADIVKEILTGTQFLRLSPDMADSASFEVTGTKLEERGYCFARRIAQRSDYRELLERLTWESRSLLMCEGGAFKYVFQETLSDADSSVFQMSKFNSLDREIVKRRSSTDEICNHLNVLFDFDYALLETGRRRQFRQTVVLEDEVSKKLGWGVRENTFELLWHGSESEGAVRDLSEFLLGRRSQKHLFVEISTPPVGIHLERGDVVTLDFPEAFLNSSVGEVRETSRTGANRVGFVVDVMPEGWMCWQHDADTYIQHAGGNYRKWIVVEGKIVASLTKTGTLEIKGEVKEGMFSTRGMSAPVEYDDVEGLLLFGVGSGENYQAGCAIDENGNLLTIGEVVEESSGDMVEMTDCIEATEMYCAIGLNFKNSVFKYDASNNNIFVLKEIKEHRDF